MGVKVENNAVAILVANITDVVTTITVDSAGAFFPDVSDADDYFYGTLCEHPGFPNQLPEIVKVTDIQTSGLNWELTVERLGTVGGSPSAAWVTGSNLELRVTKQLLEDLVTGGATQFPGLLGKSAIFTSNGALDVDETGRLGLADTTLGPLTVSLPAIPAVYGRDLRYWIVKSSNDSDVVTINCDAADNIEGSPSLVLSRKYQAAIVHAIPGSNTWRAFVFDSYEEAAEDGLLYGRLNGAWAEVPEEAPNDGTNYVRQNKAWVEESSAPAAAIPTGVVMPTATATAPSGYLLANGQPVSRTTYSALFSAIGTAYGIGDGSTTFNVPDLRGRTPFGDDVMSRTAANRLTSNRSRGESGGTEKHVLTEAEMPSHSHSINSAGSHAHSYTDVATTGGSSLGSGGTRGDTTLNKNTGNAGSHSHGMGSKGGDQAHNNMPPYLVFNWIIKT